MVNYPYNELGITAILKRILITDLRKSTIPWAMFSGFAALYLILLFFAISSQIFKLLIPVKMADDINSFSNFVFDADTSYMFDITLRPRYLDHVVFLGLQNNKGIVLAQSLGYVSQLSTVSRVDYVPSRPDVKGCPSFKRNNPPPDTYELVLFYSSDLSIPEECNRHKVKEPSNTVNIVLNNTNIQKLNFTYLSGDEVGSILLYRDVPHFIYQTSQPIVQWTRFVGYLFWGTLCCALLWIKRRVNIILKIQLMLQVKFWRIFYCTLFSILISLVIFYESDLQYAILNIFVHFLICLIALFAIYHLLALFIVAQKVLNSGRDFPNYSKLDIISIIQLGLQAPSQPVDKKYESKSEQAKYFCPICMFFFSSKVYILYMD
jgi:hypothetical protein